MDSQKDESTSLKIEEDHHLKRLNIPSSVASPVGTPTNYYIEVNETGSIEVGFSGRNSLRSITISRKNSLSNLSRRFSNISAEDMSPKHTKLVSDLESLQKKVMIMSSMLENNVNALKRVIAKNEEIEIILKEKEFAKEFYKEKNRNNDEICGALDSCLII
ncbi:hypothetical protein SteCoe_29716 [Stentor coeruleus]|uniref:Uncharacterized protein n=1 Tax=Stentor coeruleus TaxID=5963 RepID=A0A1R2B590_9CILI|nr:hypothetical protein SteCoe_29716 [Stentor coeruleus]